MLFIHLLNGMLLAYLAWGAMYQFIFSTAGLLYKNKKLSPAIKQRKIAVFIPSYKEDAVILETAKASLNQNYPSNLYKVFVIADQLQQETIDTIRQLPIEVIEVSFEKSTKSKALNKALNQLRGKEHFDIAVILDADNVMAADFLCRVNNRFDAGCRALQGRRAAKNEQNGFALLDAASEDINNHILCRGHRFFGLSARLAGSGMAFEYNLFDEVMASVDAIGGFDKELELRFTRAGINVQYDEKAIIYDEKVSHSQQFSRQRSRWLAAQYNYARKFLPSGFVQLFLKGNIDFFNKTLQMTLPPRLVLPFLLIFGTVINAIFSTDMASWWFRALSLNIASFYFAMPSYCFELKNAKMWLDVPRAFGATLIALTRIREASRRFIHTSHHTVEVKH